MVRAPYFDKSGTKRGAWSEDEDNKLRAYIEKYGHQNWRKLPKFAGLSRCGKSCRLRWMNYLRPNVKHGNFTKEEDDLIINLHKNLGNKWSVISSKLQGRSDNEIKNHWHAYLKSRVKQNIFVSDSKNENVQDPKLDERKSIIKISMLKEKDEDKILQTILSSESSSNANNERSSSSSSNNLDIMASNEGSSQSFKEELTGDFWTEPFLMQSCSSISNEYLMTPMDLVNTYVFSSSGLDMTVFNDNLW